MSSENERNESRQNQTVPKIVLYAQSGMNDFVFNIPFSVFQTTYRNNPLFDLKICSDDSKDVITALGASIPVHGGLDLTEEADIIVIAGWRNIEEAPTPELSAHLQKAVQRGAHITALCYGTYALAYTGLLDGRTTATHWLAEDDFVRRFPKIHLDTNRLYAEDGNFLTSAGAAGWIAAFTSSAKSTVQPLPTTLPVPWLRHHTAKAGRHSLSTDLSNAVPPMTKSITYWTNCAKTLPPHTAWMIWPKN